MPALAGLTDDGSVYAAGDDGLWHYVSADAFAASGFDWGSVTWYGQLPGDVGDPLSPPVTSPAPAPAPTLQPASSESTPGDWQPGDAALPPPSPPQPPAPTATPVHTQPTPADQPAAPASGGGALAGLPDGSVYLAGSDGQWHHVPDVDTFNAMGLDWNAITWYGELPGNIGADLPPAASPAEPQPITPAPTTPPTGATMNGAQPAPGHTGLGDWNPGDTVQPSPGGTPVPPSVPPPTASPDQPVDVDDPAFGPNKRPIGGPLPPDVKRPWDSGTEGPIPKGVSTLVTVKSTLTLSEVEDLASVSAVGEEASASKLATDVLSELVDKIAASLILQTVDYLSNSTSSEIFEKAVGFLAGPRGVMNRWFLQSGNPAYLAVQYTLTPLPGGVPGSPIGNRYTFSEVKAYFYYLPAEPRVVNP